MQLETMLSVMENAADIIKTAEDLRTEFDRKIASQFSIFDAVGAYAHYYNERHMAEIIKLLLNPQGSHGQKSTFLRAYLEKLNDGGKVQAFLDLDLDKAEVVTEWRTKESRRIDIYVKCENIAFGIEVKIWAGDQENQVVDYLKEKIKFLIYLSPYEDPTDFSINKEIFERAVNSGELLITHYDSHIIPWLQECTGLCQADKVRWYLQETIDLIKIHIYKENPFMSDFMLEKVLLGNKKVADAYYAIKEQENDLQRRLLECFFVGLKDAIETELKSYSNWKIEYYGVTNKSEKEKAIISVTNHNYKTKFIVEFHYRDYVGMYYGINMENISEEYKKIFKEITGGNDANKAWAWTYINELSSMGKEAMLNLYDYYTNQKDSKLAGVIDCIADNLKEVIEKLGIEN